MAADLHDIDPGKYINLSNINAIFMLVRGVLKGFIPVPRASDKCIRVDFLFSFAA